MASQALVTPSQYKIVERENVAARGKSAAYNEALQKALNATFGTNKAVEFDALLWNDCVRFKINRALPTGQVVKSKKINDKVVTLWVEAK